MKSYYLFLFYFIFQTASSTGLTILSKLQIEPGSDLYMTEADGTVREANCQLGSQGVKA